MAMTRTIAARITGTRRGARRAFAVAALAAAMIAGAAVPAQASHVWSVTDDFEGNPASRWTLDHAGVGGGHFSNNPGWAHSGSEYAYLWVDFGSSYVREDYHITTVDTWGYSFCSASIWFRAVNGTTVVRLAITDHTGLGVAAQSMSLSPGAGWTQVSLGWVAVDPDVRVYAQANDDLVSPGTVTDIRVDDLFMRCEVVQ